MKIGDKCKICGKDLQVIGDTILCMDLDCELEPVYSVHKTRASHHGVPSNKYTKEQDDMFYNDFIELEKIHGNKTAGIIIKKHGISKSKIYYLLRARRGYI